MANVGGHAGTLSDVIVTCFGFAPATTGGTVVALDGTLVTLINTGTLGGAAFPDPQNPLGDVTFTEESGAILGQNAQTGVANGAIGNPGQSRLRRR